MQTETSKVKQVDYRFVPLSQSTDLEKEFAEMGKAGFLLNNVIASPFGVKAIFYRYLEQDVVEGKANEPNYDLMKKFGIT